MKPFPHLTLIPLLMLTACANEKAAETEKALNPISHSLPIPAIKLPISTTQWTNWHCQDGKQLQTRYQDNNATILKLRYDGHESTLNHIPNQNIAIYQNNQLAFYSDGKNATIGTPETPYIHSSGCRP